MLLGSTLDQRLEKTLVRSLGLRYQLKKSHEKQRTDELYNREWEVKKYVGEFEQWS